MKRSHENEKHSVFMAEMCSHKYLKLKFAFVVIILVSTHYKDTGYIESCKLGEFASSEIYSKHFACKGCRERREDFPRAGLTSDL